MRILLEIRGGVLQAATVENDCGRINIIIADHDDIEAGGGFDPSGANSLLYECRTQEEFDEALEAIERKSDSALAAPLRRSV